MWGLSFPGVIKISHQVPFYSSFIYHPPFISLLIIISLISMVTSWPICTFPQKQDSTKRQIINFLSFFCLMRDLGIQSGQNFAHISFRWVRYCAPWIWPSVSPTPNLNGIIYELPLIWNSLFYPEASLCDIDISVLVHWFKICNYCYNYHNYTNTVGCVLCIHLTIVGKWQIESENIVNNSRTNHIIFIEFLINHLLLMLNLIPCI